MYPVGQPPGAGGGAPPLPQQPQQPPQPLPLPNQQNPLGNLNLGGMMPPGAAGGSGSSSSVGSSGLLSAAAAAAVGPPDGGLVGAPPPPPVGGLGPVGTAPGRDGNSGAIPPVAVGGGSSVAAAVGGMAPIGTGVSNAVATISPGNGLSPGSGSGGGGPPDGPFFVCPRRPNIGREGKAIALRANHFQISMPRGFIQHYTVNIQPDKCPRKVNRDIIETMVSDRFCHEFDTTAFSIVPHYARGFGSRSEPTPRSSGPRSPSLTVDPTCTRGILFRLAKTRWSSK